MDLPGKTANRPPIFSTAGELNRMSVKLVTLLALLRVLCIAVCVAFPGIAATAAEHNGFRVPNQFEVTHFADDAMAHDIFSMTVDAKGRVAVAGRNYIKLLEDTDGDGRADKTILFSKLPKSGAHG